jgi:hypothetical protein
MRAPRYVLATDVFEAAPIKNIAHSFHDPFHDRSKEGCESAGDQQIQGAPGRIRTCDARLRRPGRRLSEGLCVQRGLHF